MNKVILIGRLTKDPELSYVEGTGTAKCKFTIAVDRYMKGGEKSADFINCIAWEKQAENLATYTLKGSQIALEGRIQTGSYTKDDGTKVYTTDVVANNIKFLSKSEGAAQSDLQPAGDDECPF